MDILLVVGFAVLSVLLSKNWKPLVFGLSAAGVTILHLNTFYMLLILDFVLVIYASVEIKFNKECYREGIVKFITFQVLGLLIFSIFSQIQMTDFSTYFLFLVMAFKLGVVPLQRHWVDLIDDAPKPLFLWCVLIYRFVVLSLFLKIPIGGTSLNLKAMLIVLAFLTFASASMFTIQFKLRRMSGYFLSFCNGLILILIVTGNLDGALLFTVISGLVFAIFSECESIKRANLMSLYSSRNKKLLWPSFAAVAISCLVFCLIAQDNLWSISWLSTSLVMLSMLTIIYRFTKMSLIHHSSNNDG